MEPCAKSLRFFRLGDGLNPTPPQRAHFPECSGEMSTPAPATAPCSPEESNIAEERTNRGQKSSEIRVVWRLPRDSQQEKIHGGGHWYTRGVKQREYKHTPSAVSSKGVC